MKKILCAALAACMLLCCLLIPAGAETGPGRFSLRLHSDVAGCTEADADKLIEILCPQLTLAPTNAIDIANAAGGPEYAHMDAGRRYAITYTLEPADGFELPETVNLEDLDLECGKGVEVVYCKSIRIRRVTSDPHNLNDADPALRIIANVVVDGNALQRIIGWFRDVILKIRSWQLY